MSNALTQVEFEALYGTSNRCLCDKVRCYAMRIRRLRELNAPEVILRNELREYHEAVDRLAAFVSKNRDKDAQAHHAEGEPK